MRVEASAKPEMSFSIYCNTITPFTIYCEIIDMYVKWLFGTHPHIEQSQTKPSDTNTSKTAQTDIDAANDIPLEQTMFWWP